ncbi:hypothetical protein GGS23DRAFT_563272 [Durotheca rogersii]|uniref:uncharacterized protein n=1 Tax=Durotheca rogersii TaxID=419775 RepID=UPI00221FF9AA|nr:uncharacterized protein GGS23DRAFT_563272 [Durotheca rogersii]KAI5864184.1 hypothetical protein GGS23DRAFT_563272 [Durotheca rogersii]
MYAKTIILAALVASASASAPAVAPRQTRATSTAEEEPETTPSETLACLSGMESWAAAVPTTPPVLLDVIDEAGMGAEGVSGLCAFGARVAPAEAAAFTSFNLDLYSFLSTQGANLISLASSCSAQMGAPPTVLTSQLTELFSVYSSFSAGACTDDATATASSTAPATAASSTLATVTGSGASSAAAPTSSAASGTTPSPSGEQASDSSDVPTSSPTVSQNAGPRQTGMVAAAALAAGFVGAAMVL